MGHQRTVSIELDRALRERIQLYNIGESEIQASIIDPANQGIVISGWASPSAARSSIRRFLTAKQGMNQRPRRALDALVQKIIDGRAAAANGHQPAEDGQQAELLPLAEAKTVAAQLGELIALSSNGGLSVASVDVTIRLVPGA